MGVLLVPAPAGGSWVSARAGLKAQLHVGMAAGRGPRSPEDQEENRHSNFAFCLVLCLQGAFSDLILIMIYHVKFLPLIVHQPGTGCSSLR